MRETIARLNFTAAWDFEPIPQRRFFAMLSLHFYYPNSQKIANLTESFVELIKKSPINDSDVKTITANSMTAMLVSEVVWDCKIEIIQLLIKWIPLTNCPREIVASLVQCITSSDLGFNEIYVIRNSIWNYIAKSELQEKNGRLILLPEGGIKLEPMELGAQPELIRKMLGELVNPEQSMSMFKYLAQFDTRLSTIIISSQLHVALEEPMSTYNVSGFGSLSPTNHFCHEFGKGGRSFPNQDAHGSTSSESEREEVDFELD